MFFSFRVDPKFAAMHENGEKFDLIDARCGQSHGTALRAWKNRLLVFRSYGDFFLDYGKLHLDVLYVRCLEKQKYVALLTTHLILLKGRSDLLNRVLYNLRSVS